MQKRLPKFRRAPEAVEGRSVTERGLLILTTVCCYRFISTSDIIRLVGGNEDVTYRHLQQLYHQDLLGRIALPKNGTRGDQVIFWLYYRNGLTAKVISGLPSIKLSLKGVESTILWLVRLVRLKLNDPRETSW